MRENTKKVKYVLLLFIVIFAMAGCGKTETADQNTESSRSLSDDGTTAEETERWYGIFNAGDYVLRFPDNWPENYEIEVMDDEDIAYAAFYAKGCHQETGAGWLFSIGKYKDNSYEDLPAYEVVTENNGVTYVAIYPTDVQTEGASEAASKKYYELMQTVEEVINSFQPMWQ